MAKSVEQDVTLTRTVSNNKTTGKVTYGDWTVESGSWGKVVSPDLTNYGYTAPDKASVEAVTVDGNTENSAVKVYYDHATTTVTPEDPKDPNTPINPNDPNGPKYTKDQTDVTRDATQTITYHYSDGSQPDTQTTSTEKNAFTRTVTVDKVTGKTISTTPWTGSHTFGKVNTPVIQGYHADKKTAGGLTATPDHPDVTDQVVYTPNGKIIPVDPNGNKIPNVPTPTYPTDPTDPTKVVPDEPVPTIPGYTPETPTVTPEDPGADTPVVYHTPMTPTPEKPTTPTTPGSAVPQAPTSGATPASPTAASTSQAPAKKLPQTGDQSATGLVAAGLATLLGLMGTGLKRRKQER